MIAFSPIFLCFATQALQRRQSSIPSSSTLLAASPNDEDDNIRTIMRQGIADASNDDNDLLNAWNDSVSSLAELLHETDETEAERLLGDATRWWVWAKAGNLSRKYIKPVTISDEQLQSSIDWLQTGPLELSSDLMNQAIRTHPQLYLIDPETHYRKVLGVAPREYRDGLKELIWKDLSILQYQYNCGNDCMSECGSCWITLKNRL